MEKGNMSKRDLITKDFALYVVHYFASMQTWSKEDILAEIDRTIREAEPVEAEPVIYCKYCKSHRDLNEEERRILKSEHLYCNRIHKYLPERGFCSLGERKDG